MLSLIAVIGKNRELGKGNKLLWHIPGDLPRFKKLTVGHPVIMGRKTFESIGHPLSGRTNIVVSSKGVSLKEAMEQAKASAGSEEIFIVGGGTIYDQTIDIADRLYLTVVDQTADADTFFPRYEQFSNIIAKEEQPGSTFYILEKNVSTAPTK